MANITRRSDRECVDFGRAEITLTGADVGNTIDFAGILQGFTIVDANVTVVQAFANANNSISVGVEGALNKFIADTLVNTTKGIDFTNTQFKADKPTSILATLSGTASAVGKAIVSITYSKNATSRTDY